MDEYTQFDAETLVAQGNEQAASGDRAGAIVTYDEVVRRFGECSELVLMEQVARALFNKSIDQAEDDDREGAIATCDELVRRFGVRSESALLELVANALVNKGIDQAAGGDHEGAIATYNEVVRRFGERSDPALLELVARALLNKSIEQAEDGDRGGAIATYDEVMRRFGERSEPALLELVANALVNKGIDQAEEGDHEGAITTYDELVRRFGDRSEPAMLELVANALGAKGNEQAECGDRAGAIATYDEVVRRFGERSEPALLEPVANALVHKGVAQHKKGDSDGAIATFNEVLLRFGKRSENALLEQVARALFDKGVTQNKGGDRAGAIATYDELVRRFSARSEPALLKLVASALVNKGNALVKGGDRAGAIATYDEVMRRFGKRTEPTLRSLAAMAQSRMAGLRERESPMQAQADRDRAEALAPESGAVRQELLRSFHEQLVNNVERLLTGFQLAKRDEFRRAIAARKRNEADFLLPVSQFEDGRSLLLVLREWNSYTPILSDDQESERGGGYFLRHGGKGIVVDPGYDFISNFHTAGGRLSDIDAVVVTHAHDDHTADFEALMTLLHQYNTKGKRRAVSLFLSVGAERKLGGFFKLREDGRVARLIVLNRCEDDSLQQFEVIPGVRLTVLPAYHDDLLTADSSVGLCFDFTLSEGLRRVVFTGDTGLFPKQFDESGKPKKSSDNSDVLLDTRSEAEALYARYERLLGIIDGPEGVRIDLLVPHLGSVKEYELDERASTDLDKPVFYANHLGLRGMAILLDKVRPHAAVISEFGSELKDVRADVVRVLQQAIDSDTAANAPLLVPGDITVVFDITTREFLCHRTLQFCSMKDLDFFCDKDNAKRDRIYIEKRGLSKDHVSEERSGYHDALAKRMLPHFRKSAITGP